MLQVVKIMQGEPESLGEPGGGRAGLVGIERVPCGGVGLWGGGGAQLLVSFHARLLPPKPGHAIAGSGGKQRGWIGRDGMDGMG